MKFDERQILVYQPDCDNSIEEGCAKIRLGMRRPTELVCRRGGIGTKVQIIPHHDLQRDNDRYVAIDLYLIDEHYNVVWCEKDAINPIGLGRIFDCGKDINEIVAVCRPRNLWGWFARGLTLKVKIL